MGCLGAHRSYGRALRRAEIAAVKSDPDFRPPNLTEANVETQLADVKSELEAKMAAMQTDMSAKLDAILEKLDTQ